MSFQDTRERIFRNGQIYSRPRFGGSVHGPDTRQFTPDPNPYDVEPEPRGYGRGSVDVPDVRDFLFRPTDTFEIRKPVYRPEDKVEKENSVFEKIFLLGKKVTCVPVFFVFSPFFKGACGTPME